MEHQITPADFFTLGTQEATFKANSGINERRC